MRSGELSPSRILRGFLLLQIVIFLSAVSIHFGLLLNGYQHRAAGTAESVIAAVLLAALVLTWTPSPWSRRAAIAAQAFGILGVIVGLFTIALGVGPRTVLDLALHAAMLLALIAGLGVTLRWA
jgi:heme A synthase